MQERQEYQQQATGSLALTGNIVDVSGARIYPGTVHIRGGRIVRIEARQGAAATGNAGAAKPTPPEVQGLPGIRVADGEPFLFPGFVDAHVHIESSMLTPAGFARLAVVHGTVATVSDPHEIANVLGMEGVRFMIDNGRTVPLKFHFGAPSCVPATPFESSGAVITPADIARLMKEDDIRYLSEMMNYPGVIHGDGEVMEKLRLAREAGKVVDGHIPGVTGGALERYVKAGITTDHECTTLEEAQEKIALGMKILIREGSAAKNFEALAGLLESHPEAVMFCSDDKHPDDLIRGHMDALIRRALKRGFDLFRVVRAVTLHPVTHYGLRNGLLREGDPADIAVVDNLSDFRVLSTYIDGRPVARNGKSLLPNRQGPKPNRFDCRPVDPEELRVEAAGRHIRLILARDGQLVTGSDCVEAKVSDGQAVADPQRDILKLVVMNRYRPAPPALAFIRGFGLRSGAIASTVAHDSHNIIAVGTSDEELAAAINLLVESRGGIALCDGRDRTVLPLPVAGIMTDADGHETARLYERIDRRAKALGSPLTAPFMTLSFMALLVIPELKLSDRGLFDGNAFEFTSLFCPACS
jgi:adenine deaminase